MEYGIYKSAAGAMAAEARLDVVANNLANIDTTGFKRQYAVFQQRLTEALEEPRFEPSRNQTLDRLGGGLLVQETTYDRQTGAMNPTGGDLDVAIEREGWFVVARDGEQVYTRAGNFVRSANGTLRTADGLGKVLDVNGAPIQLPGAGNILIDQAGNILVDDEFVAQLDVRGEVDYRQFIPAGNNLFRYIGSQKPEPATGTVRHQVLENSNVSPVREMVAMIRTFRAYESNQRLITQQDESFGRAVNDVGRLPS